MSLFKRYDKIYPVMVCSLRVFFCQKFVNNSSKKLKNPNRRQDGEAEEERASELNARSPKKKGTKV